MTILYERERIICAGWPLLLCFNNFYKERPVKQKMFSVVKKYFIDRSRRHQEQGGTPSFYHWGLELNAHDRLAAVAKKETL